MTPPLNRSSQSPPDAIVTVVTPPLELEDELDEELEELELDELLDEPPPVEQPLPAPKVHTSSSVKLTHLLASLPVLSRRSRLAEVLANCVVTREAPPSVVLARVCQVAPLSADTLMLKLYTRLSPLYQAERM